MVWKWLIVLQDQAYLENMALDLGVSVVCE